MKDITKSLKNKILSILNEDNPNEGTVEYSVSIKQMIDTYYNCSKLLESELPAAKPAEEAKETEEKKPRGRPKGTGGKYDKKFTEPEITFQKKKKPGVKHAHHKSPVYLGHVTWTETEVQLLTEAIEQYPPRTAVTDLFKLFENRSNSAVLSKLYKLGGYTKNNLVIKDRGSEARNAD